MDIQYHNYITLNVRIEQSFTIVKEKFPLTRSPPVFCIRDVWNINNWDKFCLVFPQKMLMLYKHIRESCTTAIWKRPGSFYQQLCWPSKHSFVRVCVWGDVREIRCSCGDYVCVGGWRVKMAGRWKRGGLQRWAMKLLSSSCFNCAVKIPQLS